MRFAAPASTSVLTDLNLPDSYGIETYTAIKEAAGDTPIVVMSGVAETELALRAVRLGAQDFISKDYLTDKKRLSETIAFAIQRGELAKKLQKAEAHSREQSEFKSRFLAQFSHEIRTPLNAVIGMSHLMDAYVEGEAQELLQSLKIGAERLFSIVDEILDISRIEAGKIEIFREMVNVRQLVESMTSLYGNESKVKGIFLAATIDSNVPLEIHTDAKRLRQVLSNLLSNAIQVYHHR